MVRDLSALVSPARKGATQNNKMSVPSTATRSIAANAAMLVARLLLVGCSFLNTSDRLASPSNPARLADKYRLPKWCPY
jgi:hypothetical protein